MLSFFGGKSKMAEWIYQFIPKDIDTYAEVFSGSFWVYFNTKLNYSHVKNIRYNDINKFTTNLFACAKSYNKFTNKLEKELSLGGFLYADKTDPVAYKEFFKNLYYDFKNNASNTFLDNDSFNIPDYEVGMKYSFLITSAFNGCWPKAAGFSGVNDGKLKLNAFMNKLKDKKYQAKLDGITSFETLDFEEFIYKYDDEKTFFYLDPPYEDPKDKRLDWYGVKSDDKFGRLSHKRLADILKDTKGRWALSYYHYDDLETWFPREKYTWLEKDFFRSSASFSESKSEKGTELLILNYDPKHISSNTPVSEQLIDEIEEANNGAFIVDDSKIKLMELIDDAKIENIIEEIDSSEIDFADEEIMKNVIEEMDGLKEKIEKALDKKEEDIDDFWNS